VKLNTHDMLFLGSKDANVYQIDIQKGKLCIVFEGHWSKITSIHLIPEQDIMITISDYNIKVWDLQYDETIVTMNEHTSLVVYCTLKCGNTLITISQGHEYKEWDLVSGQVYKS
jgi:WD40 repeat protein